MTKPHETELRLTQFVELSTILRVDDHLTELFDHVNNVETTPLSKFSSLQTPIKARVSSKDVLYTDMFKERFPKFKANMVEGVDSLGSKMLPLTKLSLLSVKSNEQLTKNVLHLSDVWLRYYKPILVSSPVIGEIVVEIVYYHLKGRRTSALPTLTIKEACNRCLYERIGRMFQAPVEEIVKASYTLENRVKDTEPWKLLENYFIRSGMYLQALDTIINEVTRVLRAIIEDRTLDEVNIYPAIIDRSRMGSLMS